MATTTKTRRSATKSARRPANKTASAAPTKKATAPKAKEVKHCLCGCGTATRGGDFAMGHDAKLKSVLQKAYVAGDKSVTLGNGSPYNGQAPMAIAKQRKWEEFLDKAKTLAEEKANRPKRTSSAPRRKASGQPVAEGSEVAFNYRGAQRTGRVVEINGTRARVEFEINGESTSRAMAVESLTAVA